MPTPIPVSARRFLILGTLSAGIAVSAGAFGAHALRVRVAPRLLEVFETGARYQMYHALALLVVALVIVWCTDTERRGATSSAPSVERSARLATVAGWCFVGGTLLFSGSLYAMTFTGIRALGAVTPLGGVAFLVGWVSLALAVWRDRSR
jgi:uncharacterized membrane protein YgdD (TMEM256/DUF423 family)